MQAYRDFAPTQFDHKGAFAHALDDSWYVAPCTRNRDSDCLAESNWSAQLKRVSATDADGHTWQVHRFGHWACGWFEVLLVAPRTPAEESAAVIESDLEGYGVLNEDDWSMRELEAKCELWDGMGLAERVEICRRRGESIFAARPGHTMPDRVYEYLEV